MNKVITVLIGLCAFVGFWVLAGGLYQIINYNSGHYEYGTNCETKDGWEGELFIEIPYGDYTSYNYSWFLSKGDKYLEQDGESPAGVQNGKFILLGSPENESVIQLYRDSIESKKYEGIFITASKGKTIKTALHVTCDDFLY